MKCKGTVIEREVVKLEPVACKEIEFMKSWKETVGEETGIENE